MTWELDIDRLFHFLQRKETRRGRKLWEIEAKMLEIGVSCQVNIFLGG